MVRLKEICKVDWGNTNLTKAAYTEGGEYLGVSATGCDGKFNYYDFEAYTPVISAIGANCGKMFLPQRKFVAIKNTITLVPHDCIDGKYLYYAMINNRIPKRGGGQPFISKSDTENYEIPCPSLSIQREIVRIFDILSSIIKSRQQQLQKLDELVKARFVELFGDCVLNTKRWNTRRLGDIAEVGSSKRVFVEELRESGIPFFRGTEIGALAEGKSIKPELFISENHYKELCSATGTPNMGDLLMPSICPDGRIWVVNTTDPFYFKDGRVLWVHKIDRSYNSIFLLYTLKDRIMTDYNSIASGTTFAELKIFALKECRIFDAPLELQEQFAAFVTQADKSKVAVQKALDEAQRLFDSLMQKYFG